MLTIEQIANKLNVDKALAYGLVRFLEKTGAIKVSGTRKVDGKRGKPATLYTFPEDAVLTFAELMTTLVDAGSETATAETATVVLPPQALSAPAPELAVEQAPAA